MYTALSTPNELKGATWMTDDRDDNPPMSIVGVLEGAADYLDTADKAVALLAKQLGRNDLLPIGGTMQGDLRALAVWFLNHGIANEEATRFVCLREGRE